MGEELSFENILGAQEIDTLFMEPEDTAAAPKEKVEEPKEKADPNKEKDKTTEVINQDDLFGDEETDEKPESVGSENEDKNDEDKGGTADDKGLGSSPENFYSSIAIACAEDGVFPNLDEETIKKATDAEGFGELFEAEVMARLDTEQRRIAEALNNGVEPSDIRKYENTLNYIDSIKEEDITAEDAKGEQLRKDLILQDLINRGYTKDIAQKKLDRILAAGTDVEDAKEALQSNREFFQNAYDKMLDDAKKEAEREKAERKKEFESLRKDIMESKTLFGGIEVDRTTRQKALENISKSVYKDPESGEYMTALQKYQSEHPAEFLKYTGLLFTLTNGFKDFGGIAKAEVKKEMKKGMKELEKVLNNTKKSSDGSMKMVSNARESQDSFLGGDFKLAL